MDRIESGRRSPRGRLDPVKARIGQIWESREGAWAKSQDVRRIGRAWLTLPALLT
jgi:hypothetical protein